MSKLSRINYFMAIFLIITTVVGLREAYGDIQKYGWTYTQITTIGEETVETVVSVSSKIFATLFLGFLGIVLLGNSRVVGRGYVIDSTSLEEGGVIGITFPKGDPNDWNLTFDPRTRVVNVTLNDLAISFPLTKMQGWIDQYEKKKMEEPK